MTEIVTAQAERLRAHAEHFEQRDWDYTRQRGVLSAIRYDIPEDRPWGRVKRAFGWLLRRQPKWGNGWGPNRFSMFWYTLKRDKHLPDGQLDGGNILVHWEETAEYLQLVQPSVGSLIAAWMEDEPDNPHAMKVAAELQRILKRYAARVDSGDVTGRRADG